MPGCARNIVVREGEVAVYHCWSRCVQRAFLCGQDPVTGIDYEYRRKCIEDLLKYQASVFAIDVGNFSVLTNHKHLIARTRPDIAANWSDWEVAWRWKLAWPSYIDGCWERDVQKEDVQELLLHADRIPQLRKNLSSLSWFMARWKEPLARLFNAQMDVNGHFWAQRFGARELLDEAAVLACSVYVDLNQMKAAMANSLDDSRYSAIYNRILAAKAREAMASQIDFENTVDISQYELPPETAEALFADCWLAPISQDGPLMTQTAVAAQLRTDEQVPASDAEVNDPEDGDPDGDDSQAATDGVEQSDGQANEDDSQQSGPSSGESSQEPSAEDAQQKHTPPSTATQQPTESSTTSDADSTNRKRPPRASDNPFLSTPLDEYLRVVRRAADELYGKSDPTENWPVGSDVATFLESHGVNPATSVTLFEQLENVCRRVLGTARHVTERAQAAAQQWFQGIGFCREVFLDEHT